MKVRAADPKRARRGTGHRAKPGELRRMPARATAGLIVAPTSPPPPQDLPAGAAAVWEALVDDLQVEFRRASDLEAFRLMCIAGHRARRASEAIEKIGELVAGERGPMVNPLTRLERDSAVLFVRIAEQLGLTMAARLRMGLVVAQGATMLASLEHDIGRRE